MVHVALEKFERSQARPEVPEFRPGDTVRVNFRVREGDRERIQAFEGVCIRRNGGGHSETITVRKVSSGIGVERTFFLHSPLVESIEVQRRGHVRRARLYYLRDRSGKAARVKGSKKYLTQKQTEIGEEDTPLAEAAPVEAPAEPVEETAEPVEETAEEPAEETVEETAPEATPEPSTDEEAEARE